MKKIKIALAAALGVAASISPVLAQGAVPNQFVVPAGYCQITSLSSAAPLTSANCTTGSVPAGATMAAIRCEGAAVRFTDDGATTPTASVGQPILTTDPPLFYTGTLANLQFIQESSSGKVDVLFYR
jgi:hypothetical protein